MALNEEAKARFDRIDSQHKDLDHKLDKMMILLNSHLTESGVRAVRSEESMKAAHRRIDEHVEQHKERRGWLIALWLTAIGAAVAQIVDWVLGRHIR